MPKRSTLPSAVHGHDQVNLDAVRGFEVKFYTLGRSNRCSMCWGEKLFGSSRNRAMSCSGVRRACSMCAVYVRMTSGPVPVAFTGWFHFYEARRVRSGPLAFRALRHCCQEGTVAAAIVWSMSDWARIPRSRLST